MICLLIEERFQHKSKQTVKKMRNIRKETKKWAQKNAVT